MVKVYSLLRSVILYHHVLIMKIKVFILFLSKPCKVAISHWKRRYTLQIVWIGISEFEYIKSHFRISFCQSSTLIAKKIGIPFLLLRENANFNNSKYSYFSLIPHFYFIGIYTVPFYDEKFFQGKVTSCTHSCQINLKFV